MPKKTVKETKPETLPAVVEQPAAVVAPLLDGKELTTVFNKYRELQAELDRSMPDQIMKIGDRHFRKKGYWRAIRMSFNLTIECVKDDRLHTDADWGYCVTYRATAPNGASAEGDGCCMASEKSRGRMSASEHNVRSHAHTRAFNRAVSNLVGFGEVSAEEVEHDDERRPEDLPPPAGGYWVPPADDTRRLPISDAQRRLFWTTCQKMQIPEPTIRAKILSMGWESTKDISRDKFSELLGWAQKFEPVPMGPPLEQDDDFPNFDVPDRG